MTTNRLFWEMEDHQIAGKGHWGLLLRDYLLATLGDSLDVMFEISGVFDEAWPVTYGASKLTTDVTSTRNAACYDSAAIVRVLQAGTADAANFDNQPYEDSAPTTYYVGLHYVEVPTSSAQLGEPEVTGETAPYKFDQFREEIGSVGVPDIVTDLGATMSMDVTTVAGPAWAAGQTRNALVWLVDPETGTAEAIAAVSVASDGANLTIAIPHEFGQLAPSTTPADYLVCVLGPTITTVDISANDEYAFLGTVLNGVVDTSGQNVIPSPAVINSRLEKLEAFKQVAAVGLFRPGCFLGTFETTHLWNTTVPLAESLGTTVTFQATSADPFAGNPRNLFFSEGEIMDSMLAGFDFTAYDYLPGIAGEYVIYVEPVDESSNPATPRYTARLATYLNTSGNPAEQDAIERGRLPVLYYDWDPAQVPGARITSETPVAMATYTGIINTDYIGGSIAASNTHLTNDYGPINGPKTIELLRQWGGYDVDVGWQRLLALDTVTRYTRKESLFGKTDDPELAANQLLWTGKDTPATGENEVFMRLLAPGGGGLLSAVLANKEMVRFALGEMQLRVHRDDPSGVMILGIEPDGEVDVDSTNGVHGYIELLEVGGTQEDQFPLASGKKPVLIVPDITFSGANGHWHWKGVPFGPVASTHYDTVAGAFVIGAWHTIDAVAYTGKAGPVHVLDWTGNTFTGGSGEWYKASACIPLYHPDFEMIRDLELTMVMPATAADDTIQLHWDVIRVDDDGDVTVMGEAENNISDRFSSKIAGPVKQTRSLVLNGQTPAVAVWDPDTDFFFVDDQYRYYARITIHTWSADPPIGNEVMYLGHVRTQVRRNRV
jgi:hypothetical protein